MTTRKVESMSGPSSSMWMGFTMGIIAGMAAGLLAAPMRGRELRAQLRSRVGDGGARLLHFRERTTANPPETTTLTATMGEIAQLHTGGEPATLEARS